MSASPSSSLYIDSAAALFLRLEQGSDPLLPLSERYDTLRYVFRRAVEARLLSLPIVFGSLFAKVDHLLKQCSLPPHVVHAIHATRTVLFPRAAQVAATAAPDEYSYPSHLKSVCQLLHALYPDIEVPAVLRSRVPVHDYTASWTAASERRLRVSVTSWDATTIRATSERDGRELTILYGPSNRYLHRESGADWSYLSRILRQGSQLNLLRIRWEEGVCLPELIIFEPDYLVNITTVASCFDDALRETPYLSLIHQLHDAPPSLHIHLGQLAGELLDDTLHQRQRSLRDSLDSYFQRHALSLAACSELQQERQRKWFQEQAAVQYRNIRKLMATDLPHTIPDLPMNQAYLEPSFFCEALGLQGRMDCLFSGSGQYTIVEQKAGKGAFVSPSSPSFQPDVPAIQDKHWVQLLLYRAIFIYGFDKHSSAMRHLFLLYSRYAKGLVLTAQSPSLLLRAIRLRNLIVWCEMGYADGGYDLLCHLHPDQFRNSRCSERFWRQWKEPELRQLLQPFRDARPLELAYVLRFMRFVQRERLLARMGNRLQENAGFASIWLDSLEEKKAAGNICDDLELTHIGGTAEGVDQVSLRFSSSQDVDGSNFRPGDIVILYPYRRGTVPNACAQMVQRASIESLTVEGVVLRLRNSQTDRRIFTPSADYRWALEHDLMDSTIPQLQGLCRFLSAPRSRRELLLSQRPPVVDECQTLLGNYGDFNSLVIRAKRSRDLFLVIGPPGTGKTSFGMLRILQEELLDADSHVLLLSFTNRAVDEICSKLMEEQIDFIRLGSDLSCSPECRSHLLHERVTACTTLDGVRQLLGSSRIICSTTSSLLAHRELLQMKRFSLAIVDEASQILEPHLVSLLSEHHQGMPSIGRVVLIGDHKQLPAVVQQDEEESEVTDPSLRAIGLTNCRRSLFERLLNGFLLSSGDYDPRYVYMLTRQGRMHRTIADFPNQAFYGGRLQIVGAPALPHQEEQLPPVSSDADGIRQLLATRNVAFVVSPVPSASPSDKVNPVEAQMLAATVVAIYERVGESAFHADQTVGVIVPYRNQIAVVRHAIDAYGIAPLHDITIDTVERYQGSQRDYILYGFTVRHPYQLRFLCSQAFEESGTLIDRKLNVAMTRARRRLLLFGNPHLLEQHPLFHRLLDYLRQSHSFIEVDAEAYCHRNFTLPIQ